MKRTALLLALAACGPGAVKTIGNQSHPTAPAASGPAPSIAWNQENAQFEQTGLPAIAGDGSRVVIGYRADDGGRGAPNLTLIVKDRSDATLDSKLVLDANDETQAPAPSALAAANKYLADTHAQYAWTPLGPGVAAQADPPAADDPNANPAIADRAVAEDGGVAIEFGHDGHLVITQGGAAVLDRMMTAWLAPDSVVAGEPCSNPAFLEHAWISPKTSTALVEISYVGNDTCWEPDSQYHVVAWH